MALEDRLYPLLKIYETTPKWLRVIAGKSYRKLPQSIRLGAAFSSFEQLANHCNEWPEQKIREYQFIELSTQLRNASQYCTAYKERFANHGVQISDFRSMEDLKKFPFMEKRDLQENLHGFVNSNIPKKDHLYITTGGSTGTPVGFYLQKGISRPKEQAFLEAMWARVGYRPGARVAVIRGQVTSSQHKGKIDFYDATRDWLILSSYHLTSDRIPEYLEKITAFAPEFLHIYPSAALQVAEFLQRNKIPWPLSLKALFCGSERLTNLQKSLLEEVFGCRVYRWYGHSERVVLAGEGWHDDLFYFWPTYGFVEFGEPDEDGLQEIIGTSFHNRVMPLIRYRTGDKVRLVSKTDADIKTHNGFSALEAWVCAEEFGGREVEYLISGTGRKISLTAFNMHDRIFDDLYAIQFYQSRPGRAEFRYVPSPAFDFARENAISNAIKRKLGDDFEVQLCKVAETEKTPRGKHKWLITEIK